MGLFSKNYTDQELLKEKTDRQTAVYNESVARSNGDTNTLKDAKSYTDTKVSAEETARKNAINSEATARSTGDTNTLNSAKTYVDGINTIDYDKVLAFDTSEIIKMG